MRTIIGIIIFLLVTVAVWAIVFYACKSVGMVPHPAVLLPCFLAGVACGCIYMENEH